MSNIIQQIRCVNLDSVPVAMVTMDSGFRITSFNRKAEELTGFSASEAIGRLCSEILHSSKCDHDCPLQTVQNHQETATGLEAEFVNRNGESIPVRIGTTALEDDSGIFIGYLEIIEDISRSKEMEREKENFISMVAHDMKSPLIVIGCLIRRLKKAPACKDNGKIQEYLRAIDDAEQKLETLISEFLEYSHLESSHLDLALNDIDFEDTLHKIIESHRLRAEEQKVDLLCDCQSLAPINADANRLNRVLTNLLDNAIKFSPDGGKIIISAKETDREVVISFQDQGEGIDAKELPYIFDAFYRVKSEKGKSGHGLGLAAVKAIVRQHGGWVSVESTPGKGSVFTIRLPK